MGREASLVVLMTHVLSGFKDQGLNAPYPGRVVPESVLGPAHLEAAFKAQCAAG